MSEAPLDPDAYAALEEQRDFLLGSLEDLEREHDAGDIDEEDYLALKDDYTARAAAVLRALDEGAVRFASSKRPRSWRLVAGVTAGVLALGIGAGVLVARSSGSRTDAGTGTGSAELDRRDTLAQAGARLAEGEVLDAIMLYDQVLEADPDDVEALTYRGWALVLTGDPRLIDEGLPFLLRATRVDPTYADAHVFLAIAYVNTGRCEEAGRQLDAVDTGQVPPELGQQVAALQARIEACAASPQPTTPEG